MVVNTFINNLFIKQISLNDITGIPPYLISRHIPVVVGLVVRGRRLFLVVKGLAELVLRRVHLLVGRL